MTGRHPDEDDLAAWVPVELPAERGPGGDVFGKIGLLHRTPRTATVTSTEHCRLLKIAGEKFLAAADELGIHQTLKEITRTRLARTAPTDRSPSPS
jgi:CRP-like cAMP-binding protein